ncbi:hypothetical protein E4Z66_02305 [Aliishimia ponticola]|uniref:Uncharacterized protein n=1 Tax=Aliishimia ponticola TaxID=2499833 RepID=A0A4V3XKV9_9RHOB|nr:DUF6477 family protein [Aliishimia ponticola]THH38423.1 hypothetical protein E4Z66_02305 [Aliishimia ponticola]
MLDILTYIAGIDRPKLLVKAARIGADTYHRDRHLPRLLRSAGAPKSALSLLKLAEIEADLNTQRVAKDATYSVTRHVAVLSAIVGEARLMQAAARE